MITTNIELKAYEVLYGMPSGFFDNQHVVINFELTNDLKPDWIYADGKPCCVGFLNGNEIIMYLAESDNDPEFIKAVKDYFVHNVGKVYSFNNNFESDILKSYFDIQYVTVNEIKPFFAKYWNREKFLSELMNDKVIEPIELVSIFDETATQSYTKWQDYKNGNKEALMDIAKHNIICLLRESLLLKHSDYFKTNYNINSKGWLVGNGKKKETYQGMITKLYSHDNTAIIEIKFNNKQGVENQLMVKSYYKMIDGEPSFMEGSNWMKYQNFYGKVAEVGDIVKIEPDSKETSYHLLL